jgi:carboxylesterase
MIRSRWTDWAASVEDGYHLLCGLTDDIFLVGLSMGGILALLMSTRLKVKGVVAMSTPSRLPTDYPIWLLEFLSRFIKFNPKTKQPPGSGWFDKAAYKEHIVYAQNPVRSAAELKKLILEMRAVLPSVNVPVLLMHSRDETTSFRITWNTSMTGWPTPLIKRSFISPDRDTTFRVTPAASRCSSPQLRLSKEYPLRIN